MRYNSVIARAKRRARASFAKLCWYRGLAKNVPCGWGFHGDKFVASLAHSLLVQSKAFIESGAGYGATAKHVGENYPFLRVYSCEIDQEKAERAKRRCAPFPNVSIAHVESLRFFHELFNQEPLLKTVPSTFWLDAHSHSSGCPLLEEVRYLTSNLERGFIMIDDFKIPGRPQFAYERIGNKEISFDYIRTALAEGKKYNVVYPRYSKKLVSPLLTVDALTGVCLIVFGMNQFSISDPLRDKFDVWTYAS